MTQLAFKIKKKGDRTHTDVLLLNHQSGGPEWQEIVGHSPITTHGDLSQLGPRNTEIMPIGACGICDLCASGGGTPSVSFLLEKKKKRKMESV